MRWPAFDRISEIMLYDNPVIQEKTGDENSSGVYHDAGK